MVRYLARSAPIPSFRFAPERHGRADDWSGAMVLRGLRTLAITNRRYAAKEWAARLAEERAASSPVGT